MERIAIVGGGAAGFFAAISCAEARPGNEVTIYERGAHFLTKVRISGGGRCNVTHTPALDLREFSARYPRGARALIGALHKFSPEDCVTWFERRGVRLKTEADGRMFPVTDSSGTVIDCLLFEANAAGVRLRPRTGVDAVRQSGGEFELQLSTGTTATCDRLLLATGGARNTRGAELAHSLGHIIQAPVPSLFSLHIATPWLRELPGVSVAEVELTLPGTKLRERGPLLITHNGISGPVVLRLSAWGARILAERDYRFTLRINWLPEIEVEDELQTRRRTQPTRRVMASPIAPLPARLWEKLVHAARVPNETIWTHLTRAHALALTEILTRGELPVEGKTLNKDEFVSCGGVRIQEVDFKTMESRLVPHLYFAGELLDIDGITGGFNFQSAWTTGWIAGHAMADSPLPK
ncbi:MAG: NAD(P)/FAD-dependent oxidoreductase [Verrucomicrobiota bacterium]|nr:NAD(P)/FAD-dependent oxidoreductase [Verrucomicrobiota bacterium]